MTWITDEAVTLGVSDYSETSQIATLFTRGSGKVRLLAKGSKRPKNAFGGPLDSLQLVQAVFALRQHGGLGVLAELALRDGLPGLRSNLPAFYAASCAAELVMMATEELDPNPELFKILAEVLKRLSRGDNSAILLYWFEARLLVLLGLWPQLGECVACRRKRPALRGSYFCPAEGGILCRECRKGPGGRAAGAAGAPAAAAGLPVRGKALQALAFLSTADDREAQRVRLAAPTAADMRKLLRRYWSHVLGREPRAMRWVS